MSSQTQAAAQNPCQTDAHVPAKIRRVLDVRDLGACRWLGIIATSLAGAVPWVLLRGMAGPMTSSETTRHAVVAVTSVLVIFGAAARHELRWACPAELLRRTMQQICDGEAPMKRSRKAAHLSESPMSASHLS